MQKIKRQIVDRLMREIISQNQLNLFIHIAQFQNDGGIVNNLYYKDICLYLKMNPQTFYNSLYALENKGLISVSGRHGSFDIRIIDNYFLSKKDYREGYLDLAKFPFIFTFSFLSLSLLSKKLTLKLLLDSGVQKNFKIGIDRIREITKGEKSEVKESIQELKPFFKIKELTNEFYSFAVIKEMPLYKHTNLFKYVKFKLEGLLREFKIPHTIQDVFDVYYLFKSQYKKIPKILSGIYQTVFEKRSLEPKLINYLVNN
jgi:hypothetical protein